jgi:hypothetical protein
VRTWASLVDDLSGNQTIVQSLLKLSQTRKAQELREAELDQKNTGSDVLLERKGTPPTDTAMKCLVNRLLDSWGLRGEKHTNSTEPVMVVHTCTPKTQEVIGRRVESSRPVWAM